MTQPTAESIQDILDNKTKPLGSLGMLEDLALQVALLQQRDTPAMDTCELLIFIADHGIVEDDVSAFPQTVTSQMALNFLSGGAAANVFARTNKVGVTLINAGMATHLTHENLLNASIGPGTRNFRLEPAMTKSQCAKALEAGQRITNQTSSHAVCFGEMGIGNTSSASILLHKILGMPLRDLIGRGTGVSDTGLEQKQTILEQAAQRTTNRLSADEALQEFGGFEIAMMVGGMLAASQRNRLVLVDGFIATAAAALVLQLEPAARKALVFSHCSAESGHRKVLENLGANPLLDLRLRLGEGTGALLAWPLVKNAVAMLTDMASFDSAQVDGPVEDT